MTPATVLTVTLPLALFAAYLFGVWRGWWERPSRVVGDDVDGVADYRDAARDADLEADRAILAAADMALWELENGWVS